MDGTYQLVLTATVDGPSCVGGNDAGVRVALPARAGTAFTGTLEDDSACERSTTHRIDDDIAASRPALQLIHDHVATAPPPASRTLGRRPLPAHPGMNQRPAPVPAPEPADRAG